MNNRAIRKNDLIFVLPGIPLYKSGGHTIIYELARLAQQDGYKVKLVFVKDAYREIYRLTHDEKIAQYIRNRKFSHGLYDRLVNTKLGIVFLVKILRTIMGIKYSDNIEGLNIKFVGNFSKFTLNSSIIISSCYLTTTILGNIPITNEATLYNFIQNQEDSADITTDLWAIAKKSYEYPMKKIVINGREYKRFMEEQPIYLPIGINDKFKVQKPPEDRNPKRVLFFLAQPLFKGAEYAIAAINLIHDSDESIEIYSFGSYVGDNIPRSLNHLGAISDGDLVDLYNSCSIFVLPSLVEGVPAPGLEAMSCGCALISTSNGGINEYATNGIDSIIVPVKDSNAIAQAVVKLVNENKLRIKLAHNGIETSKEFSYKRMYATFKREILDVRRSSK